MIVRPGSRYIHAMPAIPAFRVLGLTASFTGPRGLAMWNPADPPILTITLSHGHLDLSEGPGVHVTSRMTTANPAFTARDVRPSDVEETLLRQLPDHLQVPSGEVEWVDADVAIDGVRTTFKQFQPAGATAGSMWWVAVADLGDVGVGLLAHDVDGETLSLATQDADLSSYECAPQILRQARRA